MGGGRKPQQKNKRAKANLKTENRKTPGDQCDFAGHSQLCNISVSVSTAAFSALSKPASVSKELTTTCRVLLRAR